MSKDGGIEFSWEVLWQEFQQYLLTLVSIFVGLTGNLLKKQATYLPSYSNSFEKTTKECF